MLYNLAEDPYEQQNVAAENKQICMEAVYYLNEWHDQLMLRSGDDRDPLWTVMKEGGPFHARGCLKGYIQRLEETGRGLHGAELKRRHPCEFPEEADAVLIEVQKKLSSRMSGH